jgi:hypothetical protein
MMPRPLRLAVKLVIRLGERAFAIDAHSHGVAAQVAATGAAVAAEPAGDVAFAGDAVTDLEAAHFLTDLDNLADVFVADVHRHGDRLLRPLVPLPDVDVGAADRSLLDADHDVVVADLRLLHLGQRESGCTFELCECLHHVSTLAAWTGE